MTDGLKSSGERLDFVHKFLSSETKDAVTFVLLHGTGGDENDLIPIGRALAPQANLLGVRGKVLEGSMSRFFRRLAEGVFDEADLCFRTHELARFLEAAVDAYGLQWDRLVAVGYSNGANIAASLLLLEPSVLAGAVLFRPMVPLESNVLPNLEGKPVWIGAGRHDPIVSVSQSERLAELLRVAGADVTLSWQPTGHGLIQDEVWAARKWLGTATPWLT
jgi:phospholipase/carboxylesterase